MNKIFGRAEDKFVRHYKVYITSDEYLYTDSEHTKKLTAAEAENAFLKGVIAVNDADGKMYTAVGCYETGGIVSLIFVTESDTITRKSE